MARHHPQPAVLGVTLRTVACAALLGTIARPAIADTPFGFELVAQHVREDKAELFEPQGFPISGSATLTFRWVPIRGLDLVTGLGYEDRASTGEVYVVSYGGPYRFEVQRQWRSVLVPIHARVALGPFMRLEAGPEWRLLLQERNRSENVVAPLAAGGIVRRGTDFGPWQDGTSAYDPSSFALALGLGLHWPMFRGDAGVGFRVCESLGNQLDAIGSTSHFREFQLVTSWDR